MNLLLRFILIVFYFVTSSAFLFGCSEINPEFDGFGKSPSQPSKNTAHLSSQISSGGTIMSSSNYQIKGSLGFKTVNSASSSKYLIIKED